MLDLNYSDSKIVFYVFFEDRMRKYTDQKGTIFESLVVCNITTHSKVTQFSFFLLLENNCKMKESCAIHQKKVDE